jgi:poly(hydroxyalkanoate) granule-associated protein
MAEEVEITEEILAENGHNPMLEMARKVLLASIGAMALTEEEIGKFVGKLVERGEIAEQDGRKLIKDVLARRRKKDAVVSSEIDDEVEKRMEDVLARMDIASKSDIDGLNRKITALSKKLDDLKS